MLDNNPEWLPNGFKMKPLGGVCMATVTVKNIPDELYDRLKSVAEINRRSINSEILGAKFRAGLFEKNMTARVAIQKS